MQPFVHQLPPAVTVTNGIKTSSDIGITNLASSAYEPSFIDNSLFEPSTEVTSQCSGLLVEVDSRLLIAGEPEYELAVA